MSFFLTWICLFDFSIILPKLPSITYFLCVWWLKTIPAIMTRNIRNLDSLTSSQSFMLTYSIAWSMTCATVPNSCISLFQYRMFPSHSCLQVIFVFSFFGRKKNRKGNPLYFYTHMYPVLYHRAHTLGFPPTSMEWMILLFPYLSQSFHSAPDISGLFENNYP